MGWVQIRVLLGALLGQVDRLVVAGDDGNALVYEL